MERQEKGADDLECDEMDGGDEEIGDMKGDSTVKIGLEHNERSKSVSIM